MSTKYFLLQAQICSFFICSYIKTAFYKTFLALFFMITPTKKTPQAGYRVSTN